MTISELPVVRIIDDNDVMRESLVMTWNPFAPDEIEGAK